MEKLTLELVAVVVGEPIVDISLTKEEVVECPPWGVGCPQTLKKKTRWMSMPLRKILITGGEFMVGA